MKILLFLYAWSVLILENLGRLGAIHLLDGDKVLPKVLQGAPYCGYGGV